MLRCAGEELGVADSLNDFFQMVEWQLTEAFMRGLSAFYQLHAAVAVYRGSALILSGPSEEGKTSLLVGLTSAGAPAYTDEIALFAALVRPKRPVACWENHSICGIGGRRALSWWGDWFKRVRPEN